MNARNQILGVRAKVASRFPHIELDVINEIEEICRGALEEIAHGGMPRGIREEVIAAFRRYIVDPDSGGLEAEEARFLASADDFEKKVAKAKLRPENVPSMR